MPEKVSLPTQTGMKKFTIQNKHSALCAGSTYATTSWSGKPCDSDPALIKWLYMESIPGQTNYVYCNGTPQWRRGYAGQAGDDTWFGHCGTSATHAPLPLKVDYKTYKGSHQLTELCAEPNTSTESVWVGQACAGGGYLWDKVTTPRWTSSQCGPNMMIHDRTTGTLSESFVDQYLGMPCTAGPTNSQLSGVARFATVIPTVGPTVGPTLAPIPAPTASPSGTPSKAPIVSPTSAPSLAPAVAPSAGPTAPTLPMMATFNSYNATAIAAFCNAFRDGQKMLHIRCRWDDG